jgi:hypothetical protein
VAAGADGFPQQQQQQQQQQEEEGRRRLRLAWLLAEAGWRRGKGMHFFQQEPFELLNATDLKVVTRFTWSTWSLLLPDLMCVGWGGHHRKPRANARFTSVVARTKKHNDAAPAGLLHSGGERRPSSPVMKDNLARSSHKHPMRRSRLPTMILRPSLLVRSCLVFALLQPGSCRDYAVRGPSTHSVAATKASEKADHVPPLGSSGRRKAGCSGLRPGPSKERCHERRLVVGLDAPPTAEEDCVVVPDIGPCHCGGTEEGGQVCRSGSACVYVNESASVCLPGYVSEELAAGAEPCGALHDGAQCGGRGYVGCPKCQAGSQCVPQTS